MARVQICMLILEQWRGCDLQEWFPAKYSPKKASSVQALNFSQLRVEKVEFAFQLFQGLTSLEIAQCRHNRQDICSTSNATFRCSSISVQLVVYKYCWLFELDLSQQIHGNSTCPADPYQRVGYRRRLCVHRWREQKNRNSPALQVR